MNEQRIHLIFKISVILKGIDALIECLSGVALILVTPNWILGFVNRITQEELVEDPTDFVATHLLAAAQHLSVSAKTFYAFYLLGHGVIKILLVIGLLRGMRWSYSASLLVLGLFVIYQLYRFSLTHSVGLVVLTGFDVLVMGLIWHEYKLVRRNFPVT